MFFNQRRNVVEYVCANPVECWKTGSINDSNEKLVNDNEKRFDGNEKHS